MAIFGFKKRKDEKLEQNAQEAKVVSEKKPRQERTVGRSRQVKAAVKATTATLETGSASVSASVIIRPRVTEKSGILSQGNVYTFEVSSGANKSTVAKAIKTLYKIVPVKVAIINIPARNVFAKGRYGTVSGFKKALVTVKKGEKIDFV